MNFLARKIRNVVPEWNARALTENDFYEICRGLDITIDESPLAVDGFYFSVAGRDFIAVDSRLSGPARLSVLFHELGHFLLHPARSGPTVGFHRVGAYTRCEREADVFAQCAIIPRDKLEGSTFHDLVHHEGIPSDLVTARLQTLLSFGI